jgi:serine protease AprX
MPKKRVLAYFMHEHEQAAAAADLENAEVTDSFVCGEIDDTKIKDLEAKGLIVQTISGEPEPAPPPPPAAGPMPAGMAPMARAASPRAARVARMRAGRASAPRIAPKVEDDFYVVNVEGPMLPRMKKNLSDLGVTLSERLDKQSYVVKLRPDQVAPMENLGYATLTEYDETETELAGTEAPPDDAPPSDTIAMATWDVQLHKETLADPTALPRTRDEIKSLGLQIAGAKGRKIRYYVLSTEAAAKAQQVRALKNVARVDPYIEPQLHNDVARVLLGLDPAANPGAGMLETGAGQVVGVADTGFDQTHPDFQGRIAGLAALGRTNDASDPHGHGTHVAGSVLGDGKASQNKYRGTAPGARLYFQSLLDSKGKLGGLPLDLNDLFDQAYQQNARIHNNSWGSAVGAEYTLNSQEVDEFVADHRDMLIVISAGNEGQAANRFSSQIGMVDWKSIGAPASSKNALTVGASRSNRSSGGYSKLKYGDAWPGAFPDKPIADETVSGSPDGLAGFSSRGPCTDRRVKPDVVAPGTDIVSAKSKTASLLKFWGPGPQPEYAYMGGTSMAAPLVAGCAALVREYFVATRAHANPSAALLKATLINSTKKLPGPDAIADFDVIPNMHQGYGVVHMPFAYPNPAMPSLALEFVDEWQTPAKSFAATGERRRYDIDVAAGTRFSICLVWTDAPGRALQNNLNLLVETPAGKKVAGNEKLPMALGPVDEENNVEVVRFDAPVAGKYRIQISASNLLTASQDFALVVTGALTSPLNQI